MRGHVGMLLLWAINVTLCWSDTKLSKLPAVQLNKLPALLDKILRRAKH